MHVNILIYVYIYSRTECKTYTYTCPCIIPVFLRFHNTRVKVHENDRRYYNIRNRPTREQHPHVVLIHIHACTIISYEM